MLRTLSRVGCTALYGAILFITAGNALLADESSSQKRPFFQKGFTFASWTADGYLTKGSDDELALMAAGGIKSVSIVTLWQQAAKTSTEIAPLTMWTPTDLSLKHLIGAAHRLGMTVMLKPQIDLAAFGWRGEIAFTSEEDWHKWFVSYQTFIEHYAELASREKVDLFCVGVELDGTRHRNAEWRSVIAAVRKIYKGPLTWASNWDREVDITWWDALDYAGVDAYYPLADRAGLTVPELKARWRKHLSRIRDWQARIKKPILFTEIGFRSTVRAAIEPWEWEKPAEVSLEEQSRLYQATFETFWNEPWFAGAYWWQWFSVPPANPMQDTGFSIRDKPAWDVLKRFYAMSKPTEVVAPVAANTSPSQVVLDIKTTVTDAFMGFGVQWDPYEYKPSPEAWNLTLKRMDFLRPAFVRVMTGANAYCLGFSAEGKPDYIWEHGDATATSALGSLLWILDYAQQKQIPVLFGEWAPPGRVGTGVNGAIGTPDNPKWARIISDFVQWLRTKRGYSVIRMYNMMNEPNGDWMWPGGKVNYEAWAAGIRNLRKTFDERGLKDLPIVGPDNAWGWEWIDRLSKEMPENIGGWEMHWYANDLEIVDGRIQELLSDKRKVVIANDPNAAVKPFFMGELGLVDGKTSGDQQPRVKTFSYGVFMADLAAQIAGAGWHGAVAWDLDDAMHSAGQHKEPPDEKTLKLWGFWNTQARAMGNPADESIRPWFTPWSLLTRLFPKGTRIVSTSYPEVTGLRVMASANGHAGAFTVMLVNNSDENRTLNVKAPGIGTINLYTYRYFDGDRPTDADGFPVPTGKPQRADLEKGIGVKMTGRGVLFLTSQFVK